MGNSLITEQLPGDVQRMALVRPSSWNEEARSFEVTISTERDVGDGVILRHDSAAFQFPERPVPMTIDHSKASRDVWGVIDEIQIARVDGVNALIGKGRLDGTEDAMAVALPRLRNGSARFSVGARVHAWQEPVDRSGPLVAKSWSIGEVSLVVVGMDQASVMRSPESTVPDLPMPDEINSQAGADPAQEVERSAPAIEQTNSIPTTQPPTTPTGDVERSAADLRRERDILRACVQAGIPGEKADELVRSGKSFQDATVEIFSLMRDQMSQSAAGHPARIAVTRDEGDTVERGIVDALSYRLHTIKEPTDVGRRFLRRRSVDLLESYLVSRGVNTEHLTVSGIIDRAFHSTSDFPNIVANVANKRLLAGYSEEPQTWRPFCTQRNLPDFKETTNIQLQGKLTLTKTLEGGEYTGMSLTEGKSKWQLATYTGKILWTRQMIINDDLGAFESVIMKAGRGARTTESDIVWDLLTTGSVTGGQTYGGGGTTGIDGAALFAQAHANTGSGVLAIGGLDTGRKTMGKQQDIAGNSLNLFPAFLLVPTGLATTAEQLVFAPNYTPAALTGSSGPNVFANRMQVIVENRLETDSSALWYLVADPRRIETIEYGYLSGEEGPQITVTDRRDPDGAEMLVRMDFGAAIQDYRGFYRSTGA